MTKRGIAAALVCVSMLLPAACGSASDPGGFHQCGGTYTGAADCTFLMRGSPLVFWGDSSAAAASVHVFIKVDGYPEMPPLFECTATAATYARCDRGYPDQTTQIVIPNQVSTFKLHCYVEGAGTGQYHCQTT